MKCFGGAGVGRPVTRAERREIARNAAKRAQERAANRDDAGKTKLLTRGILTAVQSRGSVEIRDLTQTGVSKADAVRLYPAAVDRARKLDARLMEAIAL